jgi:transposase
LPAYAPELNPTERIWGHLKQDDLDNYCAADFGEFKHRARGRLRSTQGRPTLIRAFWVHSEFCRLRQRQTDFAEDD